MTPTLADGRPMKIAIVHYWLTGMRGGERVLEQICQLYPTADLYTHVCDPATLSETLKKRNIKTTFIQKLPFATRWYQKYLPFMPLALELLDLQQYDVIISSESGPAKGIIARPDATHVCYCHSPMRYIWDQYHVYASSVGFLSALFMGMIASKMRIWDVSSAVRVDQFVANSAFVAHRIRKYYRRRAKVVHPPVAVEKFYVSSTTDDYFLWVGHLVPYKRADLAVEAFNRLGLPLLIVGRGPDKKRLQRIAKSNIKFVDQLGFADLCRSYSRTKALIFTSTEDFGLVPVEASASGRPVIAFSGGGALETIVPNENGLLFSEATADSLVDAVTRLLAWLPQFKPERAVAAAAQYSAERFRSEFGRVVDDCIAAGRPPKPLVANLPQASAEVHSRDLSLLPDGSSTSLPATTGTP